ncbi:MAG: hypothetical protein AAF941_02985 [Pseudomonadota bacterium]
MSSPVLLGFVEDPFPASVPDGLAIVASDTYGAVVSDTLEPTDLPTISKHLLMLQRETALVPLRPSPVPADLPDRIAQIGSRLPENFERLGRAVEFIVQIPISDLPPEPSDVDPKDYLRSELDRKRAWHSAVSAKICKLEDALSLLESNAMETRYSEPNVKEMASLHYLMTVELSSEVVKRWQQNLALTSASKAVLAGPWAPYSFVDLGT